MASSAPIPMSRFAQDKHLCSTLHLETITEIICLTLHTETRLNVPSFCTFLVAMLGLSHLCFEATGSVRADRDHTLTGW